MSKGTAMGQVVIVGAGPVGAAAAVSLKRLGWSVVLTEAAAAPGSTRQERPRSINLTLCKRGLRTLDDEVRTHLYEHGIPCVHRIVHTRDGEISLPYGRSPDEHLLSIARPLLTQVLLARASQLGVHPLYERKCVDVDPHRGVVSFLHGGEIEKLHADLVLGCDGANSVVRNELCRHGAAMDIDQRFSGYAYIELVLPAAADGRHCWPELAHPVHPGDGGPQFGLHAWPRGHALLFAQPNRDGSFTASLFLPERANDPDEWTFEKLRTQSDVEALFAQQFPDAKGHVPDLWEQFTRTRPAPLRSLKVSPYHFGRAVLLGDAAHTMVPFFGQGVNSGLEDVATLVSELRSSTELRDVLAAYTRRRVPAGQAITDLSFKNFQELRQSSADPRFQARHRAERRIHVEAPESFQPLLSMVSFSHLSYDEIARIDRLQQTRLEAIERRFDPASQLSEFVSAYLREFGVTPGAPRALEHAPS